MMQRVRGIPQSNKKKTKPSLVGILKKVADQVLVPHREDVLTYLRRHPELANLMPALCRRVRDAFGADVELCLELYRDPEIDDPHLVLYVRPAKPAPDLMERIEAVREAFPEKVDRVPGYLHVTTDFRRPRGLHAV